MFLRILLIIIGFSFSTFAQRIAIVGAMSEEIKLLTEQLANKKIVHKNGIDFYLGTIHKQKVVIVKSGIGKVNAAYTTALLLEKFHPKYVLFSGVAGGLHPDSHPGDIVIANEVFHHDYAIQSKNEYKVRSTNDLSGEKQNPFYFKCDSSLFALAKTLSTDTDFREVGNRRPQLYFGKIATGDLFVNNQEKAKWLYESFEALATEMEGAALAQICHQQKTPFLIIRACSDNANNEAHLDFKTFLSPAAENSIRLVSNILKNINNK
jgi:adenosylhomocysteine nucleosidase